jgi:hypothetical protein
MGTILHSVADGWVVYKATSNGPNRLFETARETTAKLRLHTETYTQGALFLQVQVQVQVQLRLQLCNSNSYHFSYLVAHRKYQILWPNHFPFT